MKNDFDRVRKNVELMASKGAPPEHINDYLLQEGFTPDKFKARLEGVQDAGKFDTAVRYSAGSGVANLLDTIPRGIVAVGNLAKAGAGYLGHKFGVLNTDQLPEVTDPEKLSVWNMMFRKAGLINDDYAPTDAAGRLVDFTTQAFTGGGLRPSAVLKNAQRGLIKPIVRDVASTGMSGLGAGIGYNALHDVNTGNQSLDNLIKIGGTFGGGALLGGLPATRGTAGDRVAAAANGVTPQQWQQAGALAKMAAEKGSPITGYEAIQKVTGQNPKMQTQQRLAEQSDRAGRPGGLTSIMQARPDANRTLVGNAINTIAPAEAYPDTLAGLFQKAARDAIDQARKERTEAVRPNYQSARSSDAEAMNLADQVSATKNIWDDRINSRNLASQISGKLGADANQQEQISKNFYPVPGQPKFPQRYTHQLERSKEYQQASDEAKDISRTRLDEAIDAERQFYDAQDALAEKNLPEVQGKVSGFLSDLDKQIRLANPNTTEGKILKSFRDELAPNGEMIFYPSQLESVYKANRDKLDLPFQPTPFDKTQAGVLGPHVKNLDSLIKDVSPDIAAGREKYKQITQDVIEPLEASQVGKLAQSNDFKQQSETFLPKDPADVTPSVVSRTATTLGAQNPDIVKRFLAQDLRRKYEAASRDKLSGELPTAGSRFANEVAGNDIQEANLMEAIRAAGGDVAPFGGALDIFRAQGMKPPIGSPTMANASEGQQFGGWLEMFKRPTKAIPTVLDKWQNGLAINDLHDALAAGPDTVSRLEELARLNGVYDPIKQQMFINSMLSSGNTSD